MTGIRSRSTALRMVAGSTLLVGGLLAAWGLPASATPEVISGLSVESEAGDINDSGVVVGSTRSINGNIRGFAADGAGSTTLLGPDESGLTTYAGKINNAGRIIGTSGPRGGLHAVTWASSTDAMVDIHPAGWSTSEPVDLNESGAILLSENSGGLPMRGAVWTANEGISPIADGTNLVAVRDIDEGGMVVGNLSLPSEQPIGGFYWTRDGGFSMIPTPDGARFHVSAVADDGTIAGVLFQGGQSTAAVWDGNAITTANLGATTYQQVRTISGAGVVLITSNIGAFSWEPGSSPVQIPRLGSGSLTPLAINDAGTVVGMASNVANSNTAFSWHLSTGTVDLGLPPGSTYADARAVNAGGTAVGKSSQGATTWTPSSSAAQGYASVAAGGYLGTDPVTGEDNSVATGVDVPANTGGGTISISEGVVDLAAPDGYTFLGEQVQIVAPAASQDSPLELTFIIDESILAGVDPAAVQVFRTEDGGTGPVALSDCTQPSLRVAVPDPCVRSRTLLVDGSLRIVALTSHASAWNFGVAEAVPFTFAGFFAPIDNAPLLNSVKAGRTVPIRFSLDGDHGLDVLADGSPTSTSHACHDEHTVDAVETTVATGGGALTYDPVADVYTYLWKTPKTFSGCRTFVLELSDGSQHTAEFQFR